MKLIVVTGRPRSGGSAVAEVLNTLGCSMGTMFAAPIAPSYRCEWEDSGLLDVIMPELKRPSGDLRERLAEYLDARVKLATHMSWLVGSPSAAIGVKSPFLMPFLGVLMDAATDAGLDDMALVRSLRANLAVRNSIEECTHGDPEARYEAMVMAQNCAAIEAQTRYDLTVPYEGLCSAPTVWVREIASLIPANTAKRWPDAIARVRPVKELA